MTRFRFMIEGDLCEDRSDLSLYMNTSKLYKILSEVKDRVRTRWKYHEMTDEEYAFIDEIYSMLCQIDQIED